MNLLFTQTFDIIFLLCLFKNVWSTNVKWNLDSMVFDCMTYLTLHTKYSTVAGHF